MIPDARSDGLRPHRLEMYPVPRAPKLYEHQESLLLRGKVGFHSQTPSLENSNNVSIQISYRGRTHLVYSEILFEGR